MGGGEGQWGGRGKEKDGKRETKNEHKGVINRESDIGKQASEQAGKRK